VTESEHHFPLVAHHKHVSVLYSVSQKISPVGCGFFLNFSQTVENFKSIFYTHIVRSYLR